MPRVGNNGQSTDIPGQILPLIRSEFSVIIEMSGHFFLEQLEEFVRNTLKVLEIVQTTLK